jgi:hypothetical protein
MLVVLLSGCTPQIPEIQGPSQPGITPTPTESQKIKDVFIPGGSAQANLPVFEKILEETGAGKPGHDLKATISSLLEVGFSIDSITHTATTSKIGQPADSVSLAIALDNQCLIGQFSTTWLVTEVSEKTVSGCLIGDFEQASLGSP